MRIFCLILLILFLSSCNLKKNDCHENQGRIIITEIKWQSDSSAYLYFKFKPNESNLLGMDTINCTKNSQFILISEKDSLSLFNKIDSLKLNIGDSLDATWNQNCCPDQFTVPKLKGENVEIAIWCRCQPN